MPSESLFKKRFVSPPFQSALQAAVRTALSAKGLLDKSLRAALSAMNLPSTQDLESLRAKVSELEALLGQIDAKVERLLENAESGASKKSRP